MELVAAALAGTCALLRTANLVTAGCNAGRDLAVFFSPNKDSPSVVNILSFLKF